MRVEDLVIEIRNGNYERIAQLVPQDYISAKFIPVHNGIGSWSVSIPEGVTAAELLRTPGAGVIVSDANGTLFSGPMLTAKLAQSAEDPRGLWEITGVDDSVILAERLAYPDPAEDEANLQSQAFDVRTGAAETVIKEYVTANISSSAGTSRAVYNLTVEATAGLGATVTASARFQTLQELIYPLAQAAGLGYRVVQVADDLVFEVYQPSDVSATVRMDVANGQLKQTGYSYSAPQATRIVVGGAGENVERLFYDGSTSESLIAEGTWSRRIEAFIDERGTESPDLLEQTVIAALVDNGKTIQNLSVTPSDYSAMRYRYDWGLGDLITVVVNDIEATAVVTQVGINVTSDGVYLAATVGNPSGTEFEDKVIRKQIELNDRVGSLERNTTGFGINTDYQPEGGTDGTQPTFSGPAIFGSYNRFGNLIHFSILVDFDTITSFGTGQYYLTLPYPARVAYDFRDGCLHDFSTGNTYHISGHVNAGEDTLWLSSSDKVSSGVQDVDFTSTFPVTLTTADSFHIAGLYEIEG